jgi:predicted dehydrogenase
MNKARIGIIGVGWWGTVSHLEPLSTDDKAEVVAVWSRTADKAQQRAARYGVPHAYTDYRRMLDECALDGVIIASTPNMHYEQARYALEKGLHVLMEKPFVLRAEHALDLQRLATEKGRLLGVCHPMIFVPYLAAARQEIRHKLGKLLLVSAHFSQRVYDLYRGAGATRSADDDRPRPNVASYADPEIVGGGEGHTQASHILGILLWLTGLTPQSVFCQMNNLDLPVDVVDAMTIRFTNGALATVMANGLLPGGFSGMQVHVQGEHGLFSYDSLNHAAAVRVAGDAAPRPIDVTIPAGWNSAAAVPRNFVRAILGEEPLYVETEVAIREALILDAAYRSAASGQDVRIEY